MVKFNTLVYFSLLGFTIISIFDSCDCVPKVVFDTNERMDIIMMIHRGTDDSSEATALSSHRGRDATLRLLKTRFYWPSMTLDAKKYVKECDVCQRVNPAALKVVPEMQPIAVPKMVFKQIGIDLITLPEVNSLRYVAVAIDYFSKWCEARALPDKTAKTVARFIYDDIICRHGCPKIEISDQGREFCNNLSKELFHITGTQHRVTSPYHPQANGLVERLNRTIKNSLLKVHNGNELQWPDVLHGVMFAYRTAQHNSTKYSPFFVLYQRDPVLPVDLKFQTNFDNNIDEYNFCLDFDERTYENTLNSMISMRGIMEDNVHDNILDAQLRQKASYSKRHPQLDNIFKKGDEVLLKNLRREDRKGGWVFMPWIGPFIIHDILDTKKCVLSRGGNVLKTKQLISNTKKYYRSKDNEPVNISQYEDHSTVTAIPSDVSLINNKKYFNPVSLLWMKAKSKQFNFPLPQNPVAKKSKKIHLLSEPKEIISILGDGNCWFRSISLWISGTEEYHSVIRSSLIKAYRENELIKKIIGDVETYISLTGMEENGTWATDIEMMATAIYLNTHIYVYTKTNNTYDWHFFGKLGSYENGAEKIEQCIYIEHLNTNHFQVVKSA